MNINPSKACIFGEDILFGIMLHFREIEHLRQVTSCKRGNVEMFHHVQ